MVFTSSITTPANTAESSPKITELKIGKGLIYLIQIYLPPGSTGLLHVQIRDGKYQIVPTSPDESFIGDNVLFSYDDLYIKEAEPFKLDIVTWNLDTAYEHLSIIHIGVVSKEVFKARFMPTVQYDVLKQVLKDITAQQQEAQRQQTKWGVAWLNQED